MTVIYRLVVAFLVGKLAVLAGNAVVFPALKRGASKRHRNGTVSLLVPMRDERANLPTVLPAMLAQDVDEMIVLDDGSTDGSADLARALAGNDPRVSIVSGAPMPSGWVGKTWAVHQLAERANGGWLVFCDADVVLAADALAAVLTEARRQRADVFSVFPRQVTGTLAEHILVPLVDDVLLCFLPFGLLSMDVPSAATANGALMVFTRDAYERTGGFAAVRHEIVEDVAMARTVRRRGLRLGLALGGEVVSTRMYAGYAEIVDGFGRGLLAVSGGSRARLIVGWLWHVLCYSLPALLVGRDRRWLLPLALAATERLVVEAKTGHRRPWQAVLMPLAPVWALPVVGQALRRDQGWKGRVYRAAA